MRMLLIRLQGQYKGLRDQIFNFSETQGNIVAFIGLNGSGKSQLLELIAETFGYLERYFRSDFKCRNWFPSVAIELQYCNQAYDSDRTTFVYTVNINTNGQVSISRDGSHLDLNDPVNEGVREEILPSHIVGYSSGLNENLQRPFMKNTVQYLDVMNIKRAWERRLSIINEARNTIGKHLTESDLELFGSQFSEAYLYYQGRYPALFPDLPVGSSVSDNSSIGLRPTALPRLKYFDHDTTALMLASMGMMSDTEQREIWKDKQRFNKIHSVTLRYDLRKFTYDSGALLDIAKLIKSIRSIDPSSYNPLSGVSETSEEFYNQFELDYLAGEITIDYSARNIQEVLSDSFFTPQILFEKLYRLQLLAADFWMGETKRQLRQDSFDLSVKKPQKWKSPIQVLSLKLTDSNNCIEFDDLSDGEAQLIQILSMASIYKDSRTLFLLDEPETHLNPSWRTYFHSYIEDVICDDNDKVQLFISTHSPFMVSSLNRKNVYQFRRNHNGIIDMQVVQNETYGASFDVLIKDLFELRSLISQSVVDEIREQLKLGDGHAKEWIENNLGLSAERAYLLRKLS
ncbi:AAA family ATPase [Pectobacterium brasiliense]|uniref:AAA family ATPase n=1 Tax=Pectobacterium brasiliense TaxID=180957 RepID=A0A3S0XW22_9GAMM|nr:MULTISPECIES: AAA family ATPase [Pectobacterium]GKW28194.1 ABC transporter [Pectobacterium carotovorum subsp. carotovorum]MBN3046924.1 AAA family ATPase [Pectobacterium brasiliense]MBN3074942.1 AAA family ATPase [Pectobacterium brasiliense]MBN3083932.1 AAA family ATPase [Pectobacterium brasiliense]MBN3089472.1 AAA family ATPase [Pectobacterium brasiliense]